MLPIRKATLIRNAIGAATSMYPMGGKITIARKITGGKITVIAVKIAEPGNNAGDEYITERANVEFRGIGCRLQRASNFGHQVRGGCPFLGFAGVCAANSTHYRNREQDMLHAIPVSFQPNRSEGS